jgi:diguanylate cyclase (GGDEF)-like protein/PAS domain S-box-containing protein
MSSKILPRYLLLASTLAIVVIGIMLSMFYGQYRWLASSIVKTSVEQHNIFLSASYERRARAQLHRIADAVGKVYPGADPAATLSVLQEAVASNSSLIGLRYKSVSGTSFETGEIDEIEIVSSSLWQPDNLFLSYPVLRNQAEIGVLVGNHTLNTLHLEFASFRDRLLEQEGERRQTSILWIGTATLITLSLCGLVIWLIARTQTIRIRQLINQAERISGADFGEPLQVLRGDELGDLADMFNRMRSKLQTTTISRDYVDSVLASMNEAIIITSPDSTITRINKATERLLSYSEDQLTGKPLALIVDQEKGGKLQADMPSGVPKEAFLVTSNGNSVPVSYTGSVISGKGSNSGDLIYAAQNITERQKAEKRIRYLARIDPLTKVPNRMQFQHLLQRAIAKAKRSDKPLCLLYVDIDHFKEINDTFGHLAGDTTLETVADRLSSVLPEDAVIGRLAGDEFAVILDRLDSAADLTDVVDRQSRLLLDKLAEPFYVQGHEVFMTASMGIACCPSDASNVIDLIRNADAALYHSKKDGGNIFSYYAPEMNEAAVERLMTKSKLKRAFERDELLVHYQPKYNITSGEIIGAEALVRWELPERGIIYPSDFIPIAEETGLIIEIGEWVLDRVCEDFRYWRRSVSNAGRISVNLSLKQLKQANFINRISSILRSYELSPTSLELEITETTLMEDPKRTIKLLDELYSLGLHLAIDDFGTGYSSLSALQQFPISTLKIDQSFVRNIAFNTDDATIVGTIIHMGRSLQMDVVAEGVETEEQLGFLQKLDCTFVQGMLFGQPMSADNYLELLLAQAEGTDTHRALFA